MHAVLTVSSRPLPTRLCACYTLVHKSWSTHIQSSTDSPSHQTLPAPLADFLRLRLASSPSVGGSEHVLTFRTICPV
ncbi:hypothetical protein L227DRAFT_573844 [Lentinus tigrinus ALCF2SS1-6]|uniref:Uncharacterized protein n=1 Tax=Lentinus tigrinus ALCF2SS1-6 TaxID=1328759 RepID=A0A5C2SDW0_9APHY|nr:hypothetical protein L227DRAFT_573844 [Lentinus tigrinus ALCF2SS1-6]